MKGDVTLMNPSLIKFTLVLSPVFRFWRLLFFPSSCSVSRVLCLFSVFCWSKYCPSDRCHQLLALFGGTVAYLESKHLLVIMFYIDTFSVINIIIVFHMNICIRISSQPVIVVVISLIKIFHYLTIHVTLLCFFYMYVFVLFCARSYCVIGFLRYN
jgi:hypothetical protein